MSDAISFQVICTYCQQPMRRAATVAEIRWADGMCHPVVRWQCDSHGCGNHMYLKEGAMGAVARTER